MDGRVQRRALEPEPNFGRSGRGNVPSSHRIPLPPVLSTRSLALFFFYGLPHSLTRCIIPCLQPRGYITDFAIPIYPHHFFSLLHSSSFLSPSLSLPSSESPSPSVLEDQSTLSCRRRRLLDRIPRTRQKILSGPHPNYNSHPSPLLRAGNRSLDVARLQYYSLSKSSIFQARPSRRTHTLYPNFFLSLYLVVAISTDAHTLIPFAPHQPALPYTSIPLLTIPSVSPFADLFGLTLFLVSIRPSFNERPAGVFFR